MHTLAETTNELKNSLPSTLALMSVCRVMHVAQSGRPHVPHPRANAHVIRTSHAWKSYSFWEEDEDVAHPFLCAIDHAWWDFLLLRIYTISYLFARHKPLLSPRVWVEMHMRCACLSNAHVIRTSHAHKGDEDNVCPFLCVVVHTRILSTCYWWHWRHPYPYNSRDPPQSLRRRVTENPSTSTGPLPSIPS